MHTLRAILVALVAVEHVYMAAIFGAATSKRSILIIQGAPAALALLALIADVAG